MTELRKAIALLMETPAEEAPPAGPSETAAVAAVAVPSLRTVSEDFRRELFASTGVPPELAADPGQLGAMTRGAFRFFCERGARPVSVRLFAPSLEDDGWTTPHTVLETVLDDRPFVIDTLREIIERAGGEIVLLLHPVIGVRRDDRGEVEAVGPPSAFARHESFVHAHIARLGAGRGLETLVGQRLADVVRATDDYPAMRERVAALAAELRTQPPAGFWNQDVDEIAAFLDWIGQKNFVYLGYREYQVDNPDDAPVASIRPGSSLGILRTDSNSRYRTPQALSGDIARQINRPPLLFVTKTTAPSPIHRCVAMDYIGVKQTNAAGVVTGERRVLGLFTAAAYHQESSTVPLLRRKLAAILAQEGVVEDSYDFRELVTLFNSIPKTELLGSSVADIQATLHAIRQADVQFEAEVLWRTDLLRRGLFLVVVLPRAKFSTEFHQRAAGLIEQHLQATILHQEFALDDRAQARLHYFVAPSIALLSSPPRLDAAVGELEQNVRMLLRTWDDQLVQQLTLLHARADAERLAARYRGAFSLAYKAATDANDAVRDIDGLERLARTGTTQIELRPDPRGGEFGFAVLKLYVAGPRLVLSDFIPVLENLGLRVFDEDSIDLVIPGLDRARIHTFVIQDAADGRNDLVARAPLLIAALQALRDGRAVNDPLNSLVVHAGLDWRAVDLLRAYCEHARQIGVAASPAVLIEALMQHPESAALLFRFFAVKFDPEASAFYPAERQRGPAVAAEADFLDSLGRVERLVHDRILRALGAAVAATVRTTFYAPSAEGPEASAIAVKIDARRLPHLPAPRPLFETWVHAPHMSGVHLRAGMVARGGIRFSDRPDDFRTEILGLMKTQVVKNAVIVPVGAKGGFIVKPREPGRAPDPSEIDTAYRTLVGALLSLADNIENGFPVPPRGLLIYDDPDPYLVVAADKGTAGFSDVANAVSARYRFWLGDAFASGGSHGYDHKKEGITARGAWECVRRHFRELGRDPDREPITVIGIGDMSGDVFGNGLLQSRTLRLRAAFDHRHIFLDPDPDPERSFDERRRLFDAPGSGWNDYDPTRLSVGGGVFAREAKVVPLSPEAQRMLGFDREHPSGEEVVRAILRMEADLLWNGGIGTYVKASTESHAEVGDHANDAVRVDASDLRVSVVAEGGNLGFTQRARVEFALAGGHINTDAIDNSGGVDLSDHEVNLKIALQSAVATGELSEAERAQVLVDLTDDVCEAVLAHNRRQALALSLDQVRSRTGLFGFRDLMAVLEREAGLDRSLEHLPTREALRARRSVLLGLTRPELAVLLAYTKLFIQRRLLESSFAEEPAMSGFLHLYFPRSMDQRFESAVLRHRLRREITAVEVANRLVDTMGTAFVVRASQHTGRDIPEIVAAWAAGLVIGGVDDLLEALHAEHARMPVMGEERCYFAVAHALERATMWVLETQGPTVHVGGVVSRFYEPIHEMFGRWGDVLDVPARERRDEAVSGLVAAGVPAPVAEQVIRLGAIGDALEIAHLAGELGAPLPSVAEVYFRLNEFVDLDWIRDKLGAAAGEDRWEQRAVEGLLEGLLYARRGLVRQALTCQPPGSLVAQCLMYFAEMHRPAFEHIEALIQDLKAGAPPTLAAMLVVMRELGRLVGRSA